MSGYLAGKVWQSDLDPELKPYAAALADIANDDGTSIYPTVEYVSWLIGVDRRTVQRAIGQLRDRGILVLVRPGGGRGNPSEYRLEEEALPARRPWKEERAARRAAEAIEDATDADGPLQTSYDEGELADLGNSGVMPLFTEETAAPASGNSGVHAGNSGAGAETAAYTSQETAAPTPPDPSSGSVPLDPPKDPPNTRNAGARAKRDGAASGMRVRDLGEGNPETFASPEYAFAKILATQIGPGFWQELFADAAIELRDGGAVLWVREEVCGRVRQNFATRIGLAARSAGLARVEVLPFEAAA